ncbi:hypothetical protein STEG23_007641 [Scotinomys teguina]
MHVTCVSQSQPKFQHEIPLVEMDLLPVHGRYNKIESSVIDENEKDIIKAQYGMAVSVTNSATLNYRHT